MIKITKCIEWDMGHRVPNHNSKCRNLHGHRYRLEVTLNGDLIEIPGNSSEGMVMDFGDIKKVIMENIHDVLDHAFMFYENDSILYEFFNQQHRGDFKAISVPFIPTAENISGWCYRALVSHLPNRLQIDKLRLYETPNSWADFIA